MRILQVVHGLPPHNVTGTEVYTFDISRELARKNDVSVFTRLGDLKKAEYRVFSEQRGPLKIFRLNNNFKLYNDFKATYLNDRITKEFSRVLDEIRPDVVHIQHLLYLSLSIIDEIKSRGIPVIFTLHDYWLICPQGQFLRSNNKACLGIDTLECPKCIPHLLSINRRTFFGYYLLKKFMPDTIFQVAVKYLLFFYKTIFAKKYAVGKALKERQEYIKAILRKVDYFIAPSQFLMKLFLEQGIPKGKIMRLSLGLDLERFNGTSKKKSKNLRFAFIGNIFPAKGLHVLIKAFKSLKNSNAELIVYGKDCSYKSILAGYSGHIKRIGRDKKIFFKGAFPNADIAKIFSDIDVLVVPSLWYENSPLVIQEALASGTVVIASKIGGIPEFIQDGINGFLFEPGDCENLAMVMKRITEDPRILEVMRNNIRTPKSIEQNCFELEGIYKRTLSKC